MLRALSTAALGMSAQQTAVDNIANNLANANTTGFKQSAIVFQDLLYEIIQTPTEGETTGTEDPATLQIGQGTAAVATVRKFSQGSFVETGNALDLAINGNGFFQVNQPDGTIAYTRDGTFTLSEDGTLITQAGYLVEPEVTIPPEAAEIRITQDGIVKVRLQGEPDLVDVGQLELARFQNPAALIALGGNLYEQSEASGEPMLGSPGEEGMGIVRQGYLEGSNVDVVQEMVNLISAQRAYEINSKMVTTSEQMLQIANNLKS